VLASFVVLAVRVRVRVLTVPSPGMVAISILGGSASIGVLAVCGYPLRTGPPPPLAT
jgi:hypothetical protein